MAGSGNTGDYVITSSGIITSNVVNSYDIYKTVTTKVRIYTPGGGLYRYKVINSNGDPNGWFEDPVKRILH
jgi:hypothetical protein